jgi:hypothetical protein
MVKKRELHAGFNERRETANAVWLNRECERSERDRHVKPFPPRAEARGRCEETPSNAAYFHR